jgi:hypothetical protein
MLVDDGKDFTNSGLQSVSLLDEGIHGEATAHKI